MQILLAHVSGIHHQANRRESCWSAIMLIALM